MTVFVLRHYLRAHGLCEVVVLNIGARRNERSDESLSTKGPLDYLWKVIRFALHGYTIHLETNGHNFKSWLSALVCSVAGLVNGRKTVIAFGSGSLPEYLQQVSGMARLVVRVVLNRAGIVICRNYGMLEA